MKQKMILLFSILMGAFASLQVQAEERTLTVDAPNVVVVGDQFYLRYTVNTHKVKNFRAGNITGFDVLMGPSTSSSSSTSIINGKRTSSQTITYTYVLSAQKEGTFTIPPAVIVADGKEIQSQSVDIKVLPPDQRGNGGGNAPSQRGGSNNNGAGQGSSIGDDDLFIVATTNKKNVFEQEAILLTYKIYYSVNLRNLEGKMPDLKGFHTQEVKLPSDREQSLEHYKGRNYRTIVWSQYVLFPQQTGELEIPSITFDATIAQAVHTDDPFEAFFNGGTSYVNVRKPLRTPKLKINVSPLPTGKPASFCGGVGDFNVSSSISTNELKENEAVTLKLIISGTGNMKLIKTPDVNFPADFEVYDPKVDNKFSLRTNGLSGNKVIEYLAIPRFAGDYTIPPVEISYFDVKTKSYKTLTTPEYTLKVQKGSGSNAAVSTGYVSKEELRLLGQDIRYINLNDVRLRAKNYCFFGTTGYWLWYIIPVLIFIVVVVICRKQAIENANIAKTKTKRANKVATRRLKVAKKKMADKDQAGFYDELLKALWGYMSDKLNMPLSELSKDNIASKLTDHKVDAALITEFTRLLNDCEFARYAPSLAHSSEAEVYNAAVALMNKMENAIKK